MPKFHISPKSGEPKACSANIKCRFATENEHYDTPEEARKAYEENQRAILTPINPDLLEKQFSEDPIVNNIARNIRTILADKQFVKDEKILKNDYDINGRPFTGHCYVASEVLYHELGGKAAGWKPMGLRHEGSSHWYLQGPNGEIVDLTAEQFVTPPAYTEGIGRGFLTKDPSKRAQKVMARLPQIAQVSIVSLVADGRLKETRQVTDFLQEKYPEIELITFTERSGGYRVLDGIRLKKNDQKKGIGTKIMEDLCEIADLQNWPLALTPSEDWGATSKNRLKNFYKRFGFVENRSRNKDFATMESLIRPR